MCGGLVVSFAKDAASIGLYHLGRLLSYVALGATAGALGSAVLNSPLARELPWIVSTVFGLMLVAVGLCRLGGKPLHFALPGFVARLTSKAIVRALKWDSRRTGVIVLGALSAFLPCGWLYTFVLAAAATKSAALGAGALGLFWLGTVPALTATPLVFNRMTARMQTLMPKLSGVLMVGLGFFALSLHASSIIWKTPSQPTGQPQTMEQSCPLHRLHGGN